MRALGLVMCVVLAGCRDRDSLTTGERRALYADPIHDAIEAGRHHEADSMIGAWITDVYDPLTEGDDIARLYDGEPTYADTAFAFLIGRRAFIRWEMGDTTGTVEAYGQVLPYRALLPDSTAGRILMWMAWAASAGDPAEGLRLMDTAERWARERGLNREAAEILRCKAELIARIAQGEPCPPEDPGVPPGRDSHADLFFFLLILILTDAAVLVWRYLRSRPRPGYLYANR